MCSASSKGERWESDKYVSILVKHMLIYEYSEQQWSKDKDDRFLKTKV